MTDLLIFIACIMCSVIGFIGGYLFRMVEENKGGK